MSDTTVSLATVRENISLREQNAALVKSLEAALVALRQSDRLHASYKGAFEQVLTWQTQGGDVPLNEIGQSLIEQIMATRSAEAHAVPIAAVVKTMVASANTDGIMSSAPMPEKRSPRPLAFPSRSVPASMVTPLPKRKPGDATASATVLVFGKRPS